MANHMKSLLESHTDMTPENTSMPFYEYIELVKTEPWVTRNPFQLLLDVIMSSGVDRKIIPGKQIQHLYHFFEDKKRVGDFQVFGQQQAKMNVIEKVDNASRGGEAAKRLWILLGPPGSAKSRSMNAIKHALNRYSRSDDGKVYTVLLPTIDERLFDKSVLSEDVTINREKKTVRYVQAPCFERPLQLIPEDMRDNFFEELNKSVDPDALAAFLETHSHYDGSYTISPYGDVSPYTRTVLSDFRNMTGLNYGEMMEYVKVRRMIYDENTKEGVGSYTPRDEKSQEAGSLVGNLDYNLLPRMGNESHPLVHDYKGELCVGANGFVEIHEILKLSPRFLYDMLFATQDRFIKPEGQPPIPFNGIIIGHTNFHEYQEFLTNPTFEALKSRTVFIEMPLSLDFREEQKIYDLTYSNAARGWNTERKNIAHVAPHSLELSSLVAVMSRLMKSMKYQHISLLQKALVYAGRTDSGVDNNTAKALMEEFRHSMPAEGTRGLDPRFIQNAFETTEHFRRTEHEANLRRLQDESHRDLDMLSTAAMKNPCVTPTDLFVRLRTSMKEQFKGEDLRRYHDDIMPSAEKWINSQLASDVYEAILKDDSIIESTWKKYTDHIRAYVRNTSVQDEVRRNQVQPDESFMSAVEKYIGIPDKEMFRKELSEAIAAVESASTLLEEEPSYKNAIKRYVFEREFRSRDNIKLLGWVRSGASSASSETENQKELNSTIQYMTEKLGYCPHCAYYALTVTANASSISDDGDEEEEQ